ncbi:HAD-IC family P-type ATPase [Mastigocoleus sp. MO_188.B34]|uniref:cation-translocating P-type ATPase n=1 Tax=Mastigocoleus sp. MO_188.B34 TaxID=3036635 RepID=UPI0026101CA0|nr:HAD-IC family P-type ATPase [Mastigocoleus sp. MO_188.B34]MDJ0693543.1 HAD-IC family P-type ATPase [Mastigocoleus sp. MO_188.B34]
MKNHYSNSNRVKKPLVSVIHTTVFGRVRYKVDGLRNSDNLKILLELRLKTERYITQVRANTLTGNVLVIFSSDYSVTEISYLIETIVIEHRSKLCKFLSRKSILPKSKKLHHKKLSKPIIRVEKLNPDVQEQKNEPWHIREVDSVIANFQTSKVSGLSYESAQTKLQQYGANILPQTARRSRLSMFIEQFQSLPVGLLTLAAGLSIATGGLIDALVIMGVVGINAVIGYTTESHSEKIIHSLKTLVRPSAWVMRNGNLQEITAQEIVPGDIIILKPGSYVPADARLIEAEHLSIDESALTGESMPVMKIPKVFNAENIPLGDRINMVYMGTLVTGGQGFAVVVATGQYTEMGKIQAMVGEATLPQTPMQKQLDKAGSQLVFVSSAVCAVVFGIGLLRGYGWLEMMKSSISLAVAAVPEGLPAVATTTLALGIAKMRKHKVLIRRLDAVETLGSIQTICMDKTGTITANKMSVVELYADNKRIEFESGNLIAGEELLNPYQSDAILKMIHILLLCNESRLDGENGDYVIRGSATENALIYLGIDSGVDVKALRQNYPLLKINQRSQDRNYMTSLHSSCDGRNLLALKGSPSEVLAMCNWQIQDGQKVSLANEDRLAIEIENERMASNGLRVLGAAYSIDEIENIHFGNNFIWLGLVGMTDPIRNGVKQLIGNFHQAGINTVMITGDQSPTAYAIGKKLNLSNGGKMEILDSTHLNNIEPQVMQALCDRIQVFARISPADKLQIVQALQGSSKIVAMTGDGINDAPALKAANVGVAMGHTGTDVAREVADVVLEDDNLETMIVAVSRGRTIYNNIRKSVHFLLSTNTSEIMVMLAATSAGIGQPLNAMQLLWLNLVTDIFPGLALALEPPEPDVLSQNPRDPEEPIIKTSDLKRIIRESTALSISSLGAYGYGISRYGIGSQASTIGFMSLTSAQLLHALSCRSKTRSIFSKHKLPPNQYLTVALSGSFALQILAAIVPGLKDLLQITPIHLLDSAVIATSAVLPLLVNEGVKNLGNET